MNPEKTVEKQKGTQPVGEFQGDMLDAARPLTDAVPEIGNMLFQSLISPFAFFF